MKHIRLFEEYNKLTVINKSFNITNDDVDEFLGFLASEYKLKLDDKYILWYKTELEKILTTQYGYINGVLEGVENFPSEITLYRLIDNDIDNIDTSIFLGTSWTYDKEYIKTEDFQNSIGFDKSKPWNIITGKFYKEDIDKHELLEVLVRLSHEKEIRIKYNHNPFDFKIEPYEI